MDRPPWDRLPFFDAPVEESFLLTANAQQIAPGDPMRVCLLIGAAGESLSGTTITFPIPIAFGTIGANVPLPSIILSTLPITNTNSGLVISPLVNPIIFTWEKHGPLVTIPWYALTSDIAGSTITVISVSMRQWPDDPNAQSLIQDTDDGQFANQPAGRTSRAGPAKLYGAGWAEREEAAPYSLSDLLKSGVRPVGGAGGS